MDPRIPGQVPLPSLREINTGPAPARIPGTHNAPWSLMFEAREGRVLLASSAWFGAPDSLNRRLQPPVHRQPGRLRPPRPHLRSPVPVPAPGYCSARPHGSPLTPPGSAAARSPSGPRPTGTGPAPQRTNLHEWNRCNDRLNPPTTVFSCRVVGLLQWRAARCGPGGLGAGVVAAGGAGADRARPDIQPMVSTILPRTSRFSSAAIASEVPDQSSTRPISGCRRPVAASRTKVARSSASVWVLSR